MTSLEITDVTYRVGQPFECIIRVTRVGPDEWIAAILPEGPSYYSFWFDEQPTLEAARDTALRYLHQQHQRPGANADESC